MNQDAIQMLQLTQGSPEWFQLRKTKITATDACVIMGANHWKTKRQLYYEKISDDPPKAPNARMQRGTDLEPIARELFTIKTGIEAFPAVVVKDWTMASLDGISHNNEIVEIKCSGDADHSIALKGKVPDHYYPQLQHQMHVCNVDKMYYFSFDGADGVIVELLRNPLYVEKMLVEEIRFYNCLVNKIPPEPSEKDYVERNDSEWEDCAERWKRISASIKELEKEEEELRKQLIFLSRETNTKGSGIFLSQVLRKGNVDYTKIPELKNVDLEKYRKGDINSWRLVAQ